MYPRPGDGAVFLSFLEREEEEVATKIKRQKKKPLKSINRNPTNPDFFLLLLN